MKYIMYLTTNIVNKKIYIGIHKTETPYEFDGYLGCGVKVNDRCTYRYCHTPFEAAVNKYGPDKFIRKTIEIFDTLEEALKREAEVVNAEFISRKDTYNIALGGGIPPAVTKTIYQYSLSGEFIKEWDSITEAALYLKCSTSSIGSAIYKRTPSLGYLWADYKEDTLDMDKFNLDLNKTKVFLFKASGEFEKEFKSINSCSEYLNVLPTTIGKAIKGKFLINKEWFCNSVKEFNPNIDKSHKGDPLYQYDKNGNFIKEWENYTKVKEYFGKDVNIHASIRLGLLCQGYQWSWEKLPNMKKLDTVSKPRKVGKYTKDGELVQVFNTVTEAKKDTCGAPNVLTGKRKTARGYIWKYIEG